MKAFNDGVIILASVIVMGSILGLAYWVAFPEIKFPFLWGSLTYLLIKRIVLSITKRKCVKRSNRK